MVPEEEGVAWAGDSEHGREERVAGKGVCISM